MNKIQIRTLNNKLDKLENFIKYKPESKSGPAVEKIKELLRMKVEDKNFEESEIIDWLAGCASFFSEVEINQEIINHFLNFFKFTTEESSDGLVKRMGPFVAEGRRNKTYYLSSIINSDYIKIAFQCARVNLNKIIEDERIVPSWLIEQLSLNPETKSISLSLESVENCYQKKDKNGMFMHINNSLDLFLSLDKSLKVKGKNSISIKLDILFNDKEKLNELGISRDVVLALNGFRIIRNKKIAHNDLPLKYDIPFIVAISFVSLVMFFIEVLVLNGEVFKNKNLDYYNN